MITWITPAERLSIVTERIILDIPLEATSDVGPITYTLLAGSLPRGLRLDTVVTTDSTQNIVYIKGSPTEVERYTVSRFVIRASDGKDIEDRTFSIDVDGSDEPAWITREGFLNVGQSENYFVLDNTYVDFQLEAEDTDESIGDILEYYIVPTGGELPPGLTITRQGRIFGFTDPVFALDVAGPGGYDTEAFDITALDVAEAKSNGFDSYLYDNVTYDYNEPSQTPRRLSRFYTFIVAVSDGENEIRRLFRIWVVTEEFLKADNSIVQVDTNLFRADNTGDRQPIWITESYLGRRRANNYITVYLDVYDPPSLSGTITYLFLPTNGGTYQLKDTGEIITNGRWEISSETVYFPVSNIRTRDPDDWTVVLPETDSELPPGMAIDSITGEIAGKVPYQSSVTKTYTFTVQAINYPATLSTLSYTVLLGSWLSTRRYTIGQAVRYGDFIYIATQENTNQFPDALDSIYWTKGVSTVEKIFTIDIIGEIESSIEWISDSDLGTIVPNQSSQKFVEAKSLMYGGRVIYELISGTLPPGLDFQSTGIIIGKVKQFADDNGPGLTRFYERTDSLTPAEDSSTLSRDYTGSWDNNSTSFDKTFKFNIKAKDSANFAEFIKEFTLLVVADNTKTFANLYLKAFQTKEKRLDWFNFITDNNIFKVDDLYRSGDTNFGIQTELKILVFAGIESVEAVNYVQAMSRNHYRKQIKFGALQYAEAKDPITQETVYEAVYVEVVDEFEKDGKSVGQTIDLPNNINSKVLISYDSIKVSSNIPLISDSDHQRVFPNSFKNMRSQIKTIGERDRTFLPLWMRSIQNQAFVEAGYVKALVLCYGKPGKGASIVSRIKQTNFDFKSINFTADRYLIDVLDGVIENKYLAFPQRGEKLP
jgi:hypothetical protein